MFEVARKQKFTNFLTFCLQKQKLFANTVQHIPLRLENLKLWPGMSSGIHKNIKKDRCTKNEFH